MPDKPKEPDHRIRVKPHIFKRLQAVNHRLEVNAGTTVTFGETVKALLDAWERRRS